MTGSAALRRFRAALLAGFVLSPTVALAQSPWKVTVTPTLNPLPIGFCAAVQLSVTDASGNVPRNPQGSRVTIADFDMAVTTPDGRSVAAKPIDAAHWSACACEGARAGTTATVTATYPARALGARSRVANTELQSTATFALSASKGAANPAECVTAAAAAPPSAVTLQRAAPPLALESAPGAAREPTPPAALPTVEAAPFTPQAEFAAPPPLPNPGNFTAVDRGLGRVDFAWQAVPNALRYRLDGTGLPATGYFAFSPFASYPKVPAGPGSWKLVAIYPNNVVGNAPAAVASTIVRVLPAHSQPWLTKNNGAGALADVQTPLWTYRTSQPDGREVFNPGKLRTEGYTPQEALWLGQVTCKEDGILCLGGSVPAYLTPDKVGFGLKLWLDAQAQLWDDADQSTLEAVYGNAGDLGVGRRAFCEQRVKGPPVPGLYTFCYATAHGIPPGQPGFNDPQTITHPGGGDPRPDGGNPDDFILSMVINKDPSGSTFLVFAKAGKYALSPSVQLDTEGPKLVPFVCLSCHGGTYNPVTRKVDGASLLPLDPGLLAFASPAAQAQEQERIRAINLMIFNSDSMSAIATYILGLYGGSPGVPGTTAKQDYVPAGWAPQSGFYRSVVKPYCAMCHLAAPSQWNFASWSNFEANAGLIHASVCGARTMPHSELQFKEFWTKNTGAVYLPGLLAATLGRPSCP